MNHRTLYWNVGEGEYLIAPPADAKQTTIPGMFGIRWDGGYQTDLQELWAENDLSEPLGHVLVREAAALASESPRSSILIMTAALETAVKMHVSKIVSNTGWLMEEMPSPPIHKVFRSYIPLVHEAQGNDISYWSKLKPFFNRVECLFNIRNKVAHTGMIPKKAGKIKVDSIQDYLELVSDMLYLLDVLDGHEWAKTLASYELRHTLNWPSPKDGRYTLTIQEGY